MQLIWKAYDVFIDSLEMQSVLKKVFALSMESLFWQRQVQVNYVKRISKIGNQASSLISWASQLSFFMMWSSHTTTVSQIPTSLYADNQDQQFKNGKNETSTTSLNEKMIVVHIIGPNPNQIRVLCKCPYSNREQSEDVSSQRILWFTDSWSTRLRSVLCYVLFILIEFKKN